MIKSRLIIKYTCFAALSILANLSSQKICLYIYSGWFALYIAMAVGTLIGLALKYFLDKRYIFYYQTRTKIQDLGKFILYTAMGISTTIIFWGSELLFNYLISADWSKYLGGLVGLMIGYLVKYQLDKRFVFKSS